MVDKFREKKSIYEQFWKLLANSTGEQVGIFDLKKKLKTGQKTIW